MQKIAVFFGGKSCENEISVLTGVFVLQLLSQTQYTVYPIYIHTDGKMYMSGQMRDLQIFKRQDFSKCQRVFFEDGYMYAFLPNKGKAKILAKIDCALNCCHGGLGEGGGLSAMMEWNNIPFASPTMTPSAVFMDKYTTKLILRSLGIPTVDYLRVNEADYKKRGAFLLKNIASRLKYPVVIKPARLGSSIGISVAENEEEAKRAIETAFALDDRLIVEKYLRDKKDVNCAAYSMRDEIIVSEIEASFGAGVYSFEEKYVKNRRNEGLPPKTGRVNGGISEFRDKIRAYTKTIYKRMDLTGVVRIDFLISEGKVYVCEVNTVPGSLAYYLFCERVSDAKTFVCDLIADALERGKDKKKAIPTTGILHTVRWQRK